MKKSPEEYFKEQNFTVSAADSSSFSPAEQAFMDKYLGVDSGEILTEIGLGEKDAAPGGASWHKTVAAGTMAAGGAAPEQTAEMMDQESMEAMLRSAPEIQMVGFFIGEQEFTLPTMTVQEVIRSMPLTKLPMAPHFMAGVINLRGKVTPLVHLRKMLEIARSPSSEDKFIIVCRRQGFQIGMLIERVHTMYRAPQQDINWNIEASLGVNAEFISGLLKLRERLVGIISVDRVIASILK